MALVLLTAMVVAAEFAFVAADRTKLAAEAEAGDRAARRAQGVLRNLSEVLSACQIGITLSSLLLGFLAEPTAAELLDPIIGKGSAWTTVIGLTLASAFAMVFGELVPKSIAIASADRVTKRLAWPMRMFGIAVGPFVRLSNGNANTIVRALGVEPKEEIEGHASIEDLAFIIRSSGAEGTLDPADVELLTRSIRFGEKAAAEVLVPRVEVEAIRADQTAAELVEKSISTGYSRFPVVGDGLDDIVGVVHVKEVARLPVEDRPTTAVSEIMSDVLAVPESRDLESLFADMQATRTPLAIVVDEHGGTAGIVSLEDLLEEIVGEIDDEYDDVPAVLTKAEAHGSYVVRASLHADEVREACGFELPDGEYETLAGFVLDHLGHIPIPGERFVHDGWRIEVVAMDRRRIATVRLADPLVNGRDR